MKKNIYRRTALITYVLLSVFGVLFTINYLSTKEEKLLNIKYNIISDSIKNRLTTLIEKKQNATLALTITLANNLEVINLLKNKNSKNESLKELSLILRKETDFKNVWFQVINNEGISLFRSWSTVNRDKISLLRPGLQSMLKEPKIMSSISIGRYDMTFKAMVPVYENNKFLGVIESITHFNSISRGLRVSNNVEPVILVQKKYKKQLTHPFTKLFIGDYYVANISANKKIMEYLSHRELDKITSLKSFMVTKEYLIISYPIFYNNTKLASFVVLKDLSLVDTRSISEFQNSIFVYLAIFILLLGLVLYIISYTFYSKELQKLNKELNSKQEDLNLLNQNLQKEIELEVQKNNEKNRVLFHQNKMASMGEMIANIAHQWRQPLSVISTAASGMRLQKEYGTLSDADFNKACKGIDSNVQYLSQTIDDFRDFITGNRVKSIFGLEQSIRSFLNLVDGSVKNDHINVILELEKEIKIYGCENELIQCFINIFNNSKDVLKDIKDEEARLLIITAKTVNNKAVISMRDSGGGIEEPILPKIFEPYFTTKHQSQGTGLGLHMTYALIVDGMDGSISVDNATYKYQGKLYTGAEFVLTLPME